MYGALFGVGHAWGGVSVDERVRLISQESDVLPLDTSPEQLKGKYGAIIISGGPG